MDNAGAASAGYGARQAAPGGEMPPIGTGPGHASGDPGTARLGDAINTVLSSVRRTAADFFELLSLELHRAGVTLMWMLALSTFGVLLVVTAWLGLMAGLALWLISFDWPAAAVVSGIALANLLGGAAIFYWCIRASSDLLLPATRRQVRISAAEAKAEAGAL
jgi:uncharacterized membrane protein YqjE